MSILAGHSCTVYNCVSVKLALPGAKWRGPGLSIAWVKLMDKVDEVALARVAEDVSEYLDTLAYNIHVRFACKGSSDGERPQS
jgi:hypothetical protein